MRLWPAFAAATLLVAGCSPIPRPGSWRVEGGVPPDVSSVAQTLALPGGRVLFVGTYAAPPAYPHPAMAVFDPRSDTWTPAASPPRDPAGATLTVLADGRVLLAGGEDFAARSASAYLYLPDEDRWVRTADMLQPRANFTATRLLDGRVLVAGGEAGGKALTSCEFYDPRSGSWSSAPSLPLGRVFQTSVLLSNGDVVLAGGDQDPQNGGFYAPGQSPGSYPYHSEEVYSPSTGEWTELRPPQPVEDPTLVPLPDGDVLLTGGHFGRNPSPFTYLYDPRAGAWSDRADSKAGGYPALLQDGRLLFLFSPYTYDPSADLWMPATSPPHGLFVFLPPLALDDGLVLAVGGTGRYGEQESIALYDPAGFPPLPGSTGPLANASVTADLAIVTLVLLALVGLRYAIARRRGVSR